jgi:hypothetical protein
MSHEPDEFMVIPLEILLPCYVSVCRNSQTFFEYIKKANKERIKEYFTDNKIDTSNQGNIIFVFALMYKNPELQHFIYKIVRLTEVELHINEPSFKAFVDKLNGDVTSHQKGGMSFKDIGKILKIIGIVGGIIAILTYDICVVMHTRELADKTSTKFNEIQEIASKLSTCPGYTPTPTEQILILGAKDPTMVKQVMSSINCLMRNSEFTIALTQPVIEKSYEKDMAFFQTNFENELPMIEGIEDLKLISAPVGKQLVLYGNPHENDDAALVAKIATIEDILVKKKTNGAIDIPKTRELIEFLAAKSPEQFSDWLHLESFIPGQHPDSPSPSSSPSPLSPNAPTYETMAYYVNTGVEAFTEVVSGSGVTLKNYFSFSDTFSRNLHAIILSYKRQFEDMQRNAERSSADYMRDVGYLVTDWGNLIKRGPELFRLNVWMFTSIAFLAAWWFGGKHPNEARHVDRFEAVEDEAVVPRITQGPLERKDSTDSKLADLFARLGPLSTREERKAAIGGRRRRRKTIRKQKNKTRKNKRSKKRKQTKARKGRRLTRKY